MSTHLQENFGENASTSLHALDLLIGEVFFTSPRLANLATQAEVLSQALPTHESSQAAKASQMLEEYQCPVCLETLHNPVVLTCAHRFCWGCLVAHCTASRNRGSPISTSGKTSGTILSNNLRADFSELVLTTFSFLLQTAARPHTGSLSSLLVMRQRHPSFTAVQCAGSPRSWMSMHSRLTPT